MPRRRASAQRSALAGSAARYPPLAGTVGRLTALRFTAASDDGAAGGSDGGGGGGGSDGGGGNGGGGGDSGGDDTGTQ